MGARTDSCAPGARLPRPLSECLDNRDVAAGQGGPRRPTSAPFRARTPEARYGSRTGITYPVTHFTNPKSQ